MQFKRAPRLPYIRFGAFDVGADFGQRAVVTGAGQNDERVALFDRIPFGHEDPLNISPDWRGMLDKFRDHARLTNRDDAQARPDLLAQHAKDDRADQRIDRKAPKDTEDPRCLAFGPFSFLLFGLFHWDEIDRRVEAGDDVFGAGHLARQDRAIKHSERLALPSSQALKDQLARVIARREAHRKADVDALKRDRQDPLGWQDVGVVRELEAVERPARHAHHIPRRQFQPQRGTDLERQI